ncbi:hypothetical protein M1563_00260 [Patescibacteria group bacterium]|nr:hypothetical protein [Patescibacteria group bacterium]
MFERKTERYPYTREAKKLAGREEKVFMELSKLDSRRSLDQAHLFCEFDTRWGHWLALSKPWLNFDAEYLILASLRACTHGIAMNYQEYLNPQEVEVDTRMTLVFGSDPEARYFFDNEGRSGLKRVHRIGIPPFGVQHAVNPETYIADRQNLDKLTPGDVELAGAALSTLLKAVSQIP